ncbi:MAG: hypothetical protein IJU76_15925, partial [Desulfovibrionaceae bacterium]|nr:hypothetical protein [Desulfovibrionaceae bacterium]
VASVKGSLRSSRALDCPTFCVGQKAKRCWLRGSGKREADLTMKRLRRRHSPRSISYAARGKEANPRNGRTLKTSQRASCAAHDS